MESVQATAATSTLEAQLEGSQEALSEATLQNTTLRAELGALAKVGRCRLTPGRPRVDHTTGFSTQS